MTKRSPGQMKIAHNTSCHPICPNGDAMRGSTSFSSATRSTIRLSTILFLLCIPIACSKEQPAAKKATPQRTAELEVKTTRVALQSANRRLSVVGTLNAADDVIVSAQVAGVLQKCAMDLGDSAAPESLLAQIDPTDYRLALNQAEAALNEVLARLGGTPETLDTVDLASLPAVQRASAELNFAQFDYNRLAKLQVSAEDSSVSERELNDARTRLQVAEADLRTARENAEATLALSIQRRASVELARWKLAQTTVNVPEVSTTTIDLLNRVTEKSANENTPSNNPSSETAINPSNSVAADTTWRVAERLVTEGQFVSIGDSLYRLVIVNPLKLIAKVPERYIGQISAGLTVEVDGALVGEILRGRVSRVSPTVNPQTRTFDIEVVVNNSREVLKAGSFGKAAVVTESPRPLLLVPQSAIIDFAGVTKAFVIENGTAVQRELKLGERFDGLVEVTTGLAVGDEMILSPPRDLISGQAVRVRSEELAKPTSVSAAGK